MTESNDEAIRDLVRRAYADAEAPGDPHVADGLREMLTRARHAEEPAVRSGLARAPAADAAGGMRIAYAAVDVSATQTVARPPQADIVNEQPPGAITATTRHGGFVMPPRKGRRLLFGRDEGNVHVGFGVGDPYVSREQGALTYDGSRWWLRNTGRLPIQLLPSRLLAQGGIHALDEGTTVLAVEGRANRVHVMELYIAGTDVGPLEQVAASAPEQDRSWPLTRAERLALAALSQRYLAGDRYPQPLSWRDAADLLNGADPDSRWTPRRVEHVVSSVRSRLSSEGVVGMTREEIGQPVGNALNHNLIQELLLSGTLVPRDLEDLGPDD